MHAVVSLLDDVHWRQVEGLWAELNRACGVKGIYGTPFPHFSYQVASSYAEGRLEELLARIAEEQAPFSVRTSGMGLFTGATPVLYVPVVRSRGLSLVQQKIYRQTAQAGAGFHPYYHPDRWIPHITLAYGDLTPANLPDVVRHLCERDFAWELPVNNIALIYDTGQEQGVRFRFPLRGKTAKKISPA